MLAGIAGEWLGDNAFRLMPDDPVSLAPATAVVRAGLLTTIEYSWVHPADGPQEGSLAVGPGSGAEVRALWIDTWHQNPDARVLTGTATADGFVVGYDYVPDQWRWEIVIASGPEALSIRMDNVELPTPENPGTRYAAMTTELTRRA